MLVNGLIITVVGMTVVFLFLSVMVLAINAAGGIIQRLALRAPGGTNETAPPVNSSGREEDIAIILAAIRAQAGG